MCKIKTRLPLTAWVLAGLVTLSSLFSTLIEHRQPDQTNAMDMAQVVQQGPGLSGSKGPVAASTIH